MKYVNPYYEALNSSLVQSPRYTVELAYDFASTDLVYFTSHADSQVPAGATVLASVIDRKGLSGTSQRLDPLNANSTIGAMTIKLLDYGGQITTQINSKLGAGFGLKGKRVRIYRGFEGLIWDDYELFQTQIVDTVSYADGVYTIKCADVQRSQRKKIFELKSTNLSVSIGTTDTLIPVASYADLTAVYHGTSYADAASSTVGYVKIGDEVIRWSSTTVDATLGPCLVVDTAHARGRGALGTVPAEHNVDDTAGSDRRTEVEEFVYLELPLVKLAYAILTGTLYGDGASLPDHWHLGISTAYVATSEFVSIGVDWWNTADDTDGRIGRFSGLDSTDGKKFLEKEIYLLLGAYSPVLADGQLGLRRLTRVLYDASPDVTIGPSEIISTSDLVHDMSEVANQLHIKWNYDFIEDDFTRSNLLIDADSISTHGASPIKELEFKGLHGSRHTLNTLYEHFSTLRDRYSGPPQLLKVTMLARNHRVEVGDIVRLNSEYIQDYVTGGDINRSFEVQRVAIDWSSGRVTVELFGSSQAAGLEILSSTNVLNDTYYTAAGTNIETLPGVTNVSGVIHVASNLDLTGTIGATNATVSGAIVYADGPLQIDSSVTLTCNLNTQIRAKGHIQVDGLITAKGKGFAGATSTAVPFAKNVWDPRWYVFVYPPDPGVPTLGSTSSQGGVVIGDSHEVRGGARHAGSVNSLSYYSLYNNNGNAIGGLPEYLIGTAGPTGGHSAINGGTSTDTWIQGGSGGESGGGLLIICRGLDIGAGGQINVSGNDGGAGTISPTGNPASGAGAGGYSGGVVIMLDGNATYPTGLSRILCYRGISPYLGQPVLPNKLTDHPQQLVSSGYNADALSYFDASDSMLRIQYIPTYEAAEEDVPTYADVGTGITVTELSNTPQTPASNLASLEIAVTAPADSTYAYSDIYYKLPTQSAWIYVGPADTEAVAVVPMDGTTYDIKAVPVNLTGVRSPDYITNQVTLSNQSGGVTLGTSNYISYGKTGFTDDINNGFWLGVNALNVAQFNIGDVTDSLKWDGTNLSITGNINAESGTIAGWSVTASALTSPDARITIDSANNWINAENVAGTNYVVLDGDGLRAYDATLGQTVNIPTDGSAPEFSSGIIHEYTYEMYTAGVIKTDADPATNGGVLINNSGMSVYDNSGNRTAYLDGINSGHEFAGTITVKGGDFPINDNLIYDPTFNEKLVRSINYWQDHARATYAASSGENGTAGVTLFPNTTQIVVYGQQYIPAKSGDSYFVTARVWETVGTNGSYGIGLDGYDGSQIAVATSSDTTEITAGTNQGAWKDLSGIITIPTGLDVAYVRFYLIVQATSTTGSIIYDNIRVSRVQEGADITDYTDYRVTNQETSNSVTTIKNPQGATYSGGVSTTGAIVITLPQSWTSTMMLMAIDIYLYEPYKSFSILCGGYNYIATTNWINEHAQIVGNTGLNNRVRFGHDGTNCCIVIGDTASVWEYPKISVRDFQASHVNFTIAQWESGWNVSVVTSLAGYTFTGDISDSVLDSTNLSVQRGLTITAGYITYGANTLRIDFANRRLTIGNEAYGGDGIQLEYNAGNPRAYIGNGSNNYLNFDGTNLNISGKLYAPEIYTATSGSRIEINPGLDNQMHFYANDGVSIAEVAKVGLNTDGTYNYTAVFGSIASGRTIGGIRALSASATAIHAQTNSSTGKAVHASTGAGGVGYYTDVQAATGNTSIGLKIDVSYTVGYYNVHMQLTPQSGLVGTPLNTFGSNGGLTVNSAGDLWFKKAGVWQKLSV